MTVTLGVEEFQGLYGPFQVSELLIQKVWLQGAFDGSRLKDHWGRRVEVISPGRWNRLAGPDFKNGFRRQLHAVDAYAAVLNRDGTDGTFKE